MTFTSFQTAVYKKVIGFDGLMLGVNGEHSCTDGAVPQRSTISDAPGRKLGQKKGKSKYHICVCCRHHNRLSKALLVSPHYDVGSTSITVTYRSNSNSPAKLITKVQTRDLPVQIKSAN